MSQNTTVGHTYKHRTFCYMGNQVSVNTRYFQVVGGIVPFSALIPAMDGILAPLYIQLLANPAVYVGSDMQDVTGAPPHNNQVGTQANTGNGTGGSQPIPAQVAGIYTTYCLASGRGYRGRQYIPFPSTDMSETVPPVTTVAYQTNLISLASATTNQTSYTVSGTTVTVQWGIVHQSPAGLKGTFSALVGYAAGHNWATQRRRGDFGRTNPYPVP